MMLTSCISSSGIGSGNVDGRDYNGLFPTVRGVYSLSEPRADDDARKFQFEHTIEFDLAVTSGVFDRRSATGPTDYRLLHGSMAYRPGFVAGPFQLHGLFGVGGDRVELSGNPQANLEEAVWGPLVGGDIRYRLLDWLSPYARLTGQVMESSSYTSHIEAGLAFVPSTNAEVFVAFRRWEAKYGGHTGSLGGIQGGFDGDWEGIAIGLLVRL